MQLETKKANTASLKDPQWQLANGGHGVIDRCQTKLWKIQSEVIAMGALFRNLGSSDFSEEELRGIGLFLTRMGSQLGKVSETLSTSIGKREDV